MKRLGTLNIMIRDFLWNRKAFQFKLEIIQDNPAFDLLKENIVYVVVKNHPRWAYLKCPSGCNEIIMLSLDKTHYPSWSIKQDQIGRPTITPSIRKLDGCKSHFIISSGKLIWAFNL